VVIDIHEARLLAPAAVAGLTPEQHTALRADQSNPWLQLESLLPHVGYKIAADGRTVFDMLRACEESISGT
jgi:hypothetical protein